MVSRPHLAPRPPTYADLRALPAHVVGEILDGELIVSPRPASAHAYAAGKIHRDTDGSFGSDGPGGPGGWWILFEPELHVDAEVVVPDVAGWRRESMPAFPDVAFFTQAPDWACEVASPSTVRVDRLHKMSFYGRVGTRHVWLVDPVAQTVECYRREGERWVVAALVGGRQRVRLEPFEAAELDLAAWWPPLERG
jgi:Uma2 family endonuclease